jgi:electron transfer flavoprotein alpha subunit
MSNVLVIVETAGGRVRSSSLPGITCGQELARARGVALQILVLGGADAAAAAGEVAGYGASAVLVGSHAALEPFTAEAWADAIVAVARSSGAAVVGGTATSGLRDALPRAAAILDAPLVPEVVAVRGADVVARPVASGRALIEVRPEGAPWCFTARASEFAAPAAGPAAPVQTVDVGTPTTRGVTVISVEKTQSARPALTEASVIVSGGRGMREAANFKLLEELTDLLGGALGASRAATDAGMVPADLQVGQTGKVVAPDLYIAVAISGAIQHLAGMKGSKTIVAINKDPEAPILQVADYGLVAKWEDAVPRLIELVRARKSG